VEQADETKVKVMPLNASCSVADPEPLLEGNYSEAEVQKWKTDGMNESEVRAARLRSIEDEMEKLNAVHEEKK